MRLFPCLVLSVLMTTSLAACADISPTPASDFRVKVVTGPDGRAVAIPPECPSWSEGYVRLEDNQPWEQFGCATQRNLAAMIENPNDLVQPKTLGDGNGELSAASITLYKTGKTKTLVNPTATTTSN